MKFLSWLIPISLASIAIFFLPAAQDFYDLGKWFFLIILSVIFVLRFAWILAHRHTHLVVSLNGVTAGMGLMTLAGVASLFGASTNKVEALTHPLGIGTFAALTFIGMTFPTVRDEHTYGRLLWSFFSVSTILALLVIYQVFGMGRVMFPGVAFFADPLWTPTGSTIGTVTILLLALPLLVSHVREAFKRKAETHLAALIIMTIVVSIGIGISLWQLIPRMPASILPFSQGWAIMLEILKSPKQALFGVGTENFLAAFSAARPASVNITPLWSVRFLVNSSAFFHYTTVWGLLGLASLLVVSRNFLRKQTETHQIPGLSTSLFLGLASLVLTPPSVAVIGVVFLLLLLSEAHLPGITIHATRVSLPKRICILIALTLTILGSVYGAGRAYAAEWYFYRSLIAAKNNNGTQTYNFQTKAIQANPQNSKLHIYYSQTNLALATSLATSLSESPEATTGAQEDRELVAQLVSQSIREAKTAVTLNALNILAWENLARIYQQLIGVAQGADGWAVATLKEAIKRDPVNPVLPLELGGIYIQMKQYTDAIPQFDRATQLKPDYANAWYNLGNVYKLTGDMTRAKEAWEQAQRFVAPGSQDYSLITNELSGLERPNTDTPSAPTEPTTLTTPAPTPLLVPPLEIPNN